MKILHTSDWHLGHTLYNFDRTREQNSMLEQMVGIVADEKPDVFLLCGDVYHTPQPSAAVQTMLSEALVKIHEANPQMDIVVTAGNHDSGSRHEIFRTPWQALNVHMTGNLDRTNPENHIIGMPGKGYVIAVPYTHERNIPEGFFQLLLDMVAERNTDNLPVIMTAHTTVQGCDFRGHDHASEYAVGGIDSLDLVRMGEGYDYLALGHIHHGQFVHGSRHNVRYCGTPLPVSFDENFSHSVSMVEIGSHGLQPKVRTVEISNPHPLVTLPTEGTATWERARELLKDFPSDIPAYIRLNVEIEDFLPAEAYAEAVTLTKGKACRFCHINAIRKTAGQTGSKVLSVQEFRSEAPIDIAKRYAEDLGLPFDHEMQELFREAVEMVREDARKA